MGTGTTYADFHCGCKIPLRNELLKTAVRGAARTSEVKRNRGSHLIRYIYVLNSAFSLGPIYRVTTYVTLPLSVIDTLP